MARFNAVRKWIVSVLVVVGGTALVGPDAAGISKPAWVKFESQGQGFSVQMPGDAETKETHNKTFIGDIVTYLYYVENGNDSYAVDDTDLPEFAVFFAGPDLIFDHAKGALLSYTLSKSLLFTDITLNGVQGKRLVYDTPSKPGHPEMQGEARFFLSGDRLYTAGVVVEMDGGNEKAMRFFSSFEFHK